MARVNRFRFSIKHKIIVLGVAAVVIAAAVAAYAWWRETPSLLSLLPSSTVGVAEIDAPWWWRASASARQRENVNGAILKFEKSQNISIERDILPWAGKMGGAVFLPTNASTEPNNELFFEIRDLPSFTRTLARFQSATAKLRNPKVPGLKWSNHLYHSVEIYTLERADKVPIESTIIRNWFIIGDANAVNQTIDAWTGRIPSLSKSAEWNAALSNIPEHQQLWGGINSGKLLDYVTRQQKSSSSLFAASGQMLKLKQAVYVFSFADIGNGLRFDSASAPLSPELKHLTAVEHNAVTPVSAAQFKTIPNDATAAFIAGGVGPSWAQSVDQSMNILNMLPTAAKGNSAASTLQPNIKKIFTTIFDLCKPFTQGGTMSVVANKHNGIGLVISGQTSTTAKAKAAAANIASVLKTNGVDAVQSNGAYFVQLPGVPSKSDVPFDISPAFKANDNLVRLSTSKKLLDDPVGDTSFVLPAEASGAPFIGVGNFDFQQLIPRTPAAVSVMNTLKISSADWWTYGKTAPDGSWSKETFVIENWDYHNGVKCLLNLIDQH